MNPMVADAIGSILRWGLALGAGYFVHKGIWTSSDATTYVTAASLGILTLGWSLWQKYEARLKLLTALTLPVGSTESSVERKMASTVPLPAVTTPKDVVPIPVV